MYKLLLGTDQKDIQTAFQTFDWEKLGFKPPLIATTAEETINLINSRPVDAVGYHFEKKSFVPLDRYLHNERPSLPVFAVIHDSDKQESILRETQMLLKRLHTDYADEQYDEQMMVSVIRNELINNLLSGKITDFDVVKRQLKLIRSHLSTSRPCVIYELDMPQGNVYLTEHVHAQDRLECALRNNFFGSYVDNIYYAVTVLTPRRIRLAAFPMGGKEYEEPREQFESRANEHVNESIDRIKEYLDLDIDIIASGTIDSMQALVSNVEHKKE